MPDEYFKEGAAVLLLRRDVKLRITHFRRNKLAGMCAFNIHVRVNVG